MIGYISSRISEGGDYIDEETRMPVVTEESWSEQIKCSYVPNRRNTVGTVQSGEFKIASYLISIDMLDWNIFDVSMIRLFNKDKKQIKQGSVLTLDELEDVQVIEISI